MSNNSTIKCPNCNHSFPIGNALAHEIEFEIKQRYLKQYNKDKSEFEAKETAINKEKENLKLLQENQNKLIEERVAAEKLTLEQQAVKKAASEVELIIKSLNEQLTEKEQKLKLSQQTELDLIKLQNTLKEKEQEIELTIQKKLQAERNLLIENLKKQEFEKNQLKETEQQQRENELKKQLEDQKKLIAEMQRKAEQGSMQLQGEVQEIALEELLKLAFPFDSVEAIAKGAQGADSVLTVRNNIATECGKIIYESKRTKAFANEWIEKLKTDMRTKQADIAVLVTQTLPKDMDTFGFKDGVWICRFADVKALTVLLRDSLIKINAATNSQIGKGDKMQMLYDFLTGNEFKQSMDAIAEGYLSLREGIVKERMQMEKIWKEREKQLDKVLLNTSQFYGSIQGIAGSAVSNLKMLE